MAFIAIHDDEKKGAWEVPLKEDAYCTECGARMRVWSEAEDGTARHFKDISNMGGGSANSSGGHAPGCSGGEGDKHRRWKNFAAERLSEVFDTADKPTVEMKLAAPHTEKSHREADTVAIFDERDEQLGTGIAVEVQHKNESKDIEGTIRDYVTQDIAVAWLDESDFTQTGCRLTEADFRQRAAESVSPLMFYEQPEMLLHIQYHQLAVFATLQTVRNERAELDWDECDDDLQPREYHTPAKLPAAYFDEECHRIWEAQEWDDLFANETAHYIAEGLAAGPPASTLPKPTLPENVVDKIKYETHEWSELFEPGTRRAILQGLLADLPATSRPPARLPDPVSERLAYESDGWIHAPTASDYIPRTETPQLSFEATLPLAVLGELYTANRDRLDPPPTPFDDVQCHVCGVYRYAPSAPACCENCGAPYDWEWNIETGRISPDNTPAEANS